MRTPKLDEFANNIFAKLKTEDAVYTHNNGDNSTTMTTDFDGYKLEVSSTGNDVQIVCSSKDDTPQCFMEITPEEIKVTPYEGSDTETIETLKELILSKI
jgi:hypothetical protein